MNNDEYLAICENSNPVKVLIKLTFKTDKEKDVWGQIIFELMNPQLVKEAVKDNITSTRLETVPENHLES